MFKTFRMPAAVAARRTISIPGRGSTVAVPCRQTLADAASTLLNMRGLYEVLGGITRAPYQQQQYLWLQVAIPIMQAYVDALRAACERMERTGIAEPLPPAPMLPVAPAGQVTTITTTSSVLPTVWSVASAASAGAGAYHGYKRNKSVGWALWWALMGGAFPVITPAIALAQGFGKPERAPRKNPARRH